MLCVQRLSLPLVAYEILGRVQFPFDFSLVAITPIHASELFVTQRVKNNKGNGIMDTKVIE